MNVTVGSIIYVWVRSIWWKPVKEIFCLIQSNKHATQKWTQEKYSSVCVIHISAPLFLGSLSTVKNDSLPISPSEPLVEIRVISFQVQWRIRKGSYKEWLFFPEETENSWKKRVIGKFPGSCQDFKQDFRLKTPSSLFFVDQDPVRKSINLGRNV